MDDPTPRKAYLELTKKPLFPNYCCQQCGAQIGWIGRLLLWLHNCEKGGSK